ncbi:T9SS type A sorting domain-containing protein [Chryseobacterium sp. Hurlbut01]|jgi:hypothetical protein|uniref:T9SS type A sorting domain-containing protein n=1 Tax=Chryseobacterium sp. Hurlbut01 TaxID=1681828 RepID=UPI00067CEE94|nr:T9SS type A sorting domain-containing protein [Chryseobacterium sp. Hurlbut01]KNB63071.1 hypothetical protein AC804_00190 [Chryseobacterium sp. Hurlbut01]
MKKNLLTIGLLSLTVSINAQNVLLHVDNTAKMYVSSGTLVYNGGGLQTRGDGIIDLYGNMMIEGVEANNDVVRTITTGGTAKLDGSNIVLRFNDPDNPTTSTYGQLYINGLTQSKISAIVSKEFKAPRHGALTGSYFQQIAIPFAGKALNTLSTELAKTFGTTRFTQNEILRYDNSLVISHHYTDLSTTTSVPTQYYMLGSKNGNLNTATPPTTMPRIGLPADNGKVFTISGVPYTSSTAATSSVTLFNAGNGINFGTGGNNINQYLEKYNTYLQDNLQLTVGAAWASDYGKNMYQYGNPFLTNLDLSRIGYTESAAIGDGNNISNIWGVRYDPGTVITLSNGSTYSTGALIQTFSNSPGTIGVPVGDTGLIIKPMQSFVIKLRNNSASQTLNFNTLRRFSSTVRAAGTDYTVTAAKNTSNSIKQLGVIALDAAGNEVGRTYYVVSPTSITGHQNNAATSVQAGNSGGNLIGTFEEALNGGYDLNYTSSYWLYINEANEVDFLGKNVKLANYDYGVNNVAVSYKFEIKENAELVPSGTHLLSAGIGFYYKAPNGTAQQITQGAIVPIVGAEYDLYYGAPNSSTLGTENIVKPSRTMVVYNPEITDYIVRFDPNWKKADIQVYDMSGKLIISEKGVKTSLDFVIKLDNSIKSSYVVKIVADNGETVNAKILK